MRRGLRRHWMHIRGLRRGRPARTALAQTAREHLHNQGTHARPRLVVRLSGLLAVMMAAASCGLSTGGHSGNTPTSGGTATYALPANSTPNYIFPFAPGQYFTVVNTDNLQYLLYRPLYWFGDNGRPYLNPKLSLAEQPRYQGQTVTIRMKRGYQWSNHEPVSAQDVVFWMHMMKAVVKRSTSAINWGGYIPGDFPDNVRNIRAFGSDEVQMTIIGKYNREWFTYNELSQITPMPMAWDVSGAGHESNCTQNIGDCIAVFTYLDGLSKNPDTWSRSPLWRIVDGPWRLTSLNSQGVLTFAYNNSYSGPVPKHHITGFKELPFTSEEAEYNVLAAGGSNPLDVGYLPTVNAPVPPPGKAVGENPVAGYRLQPLFTWGLSYFPYNFSSSNPQLPIISQQYFRQAIQWLENQAAIIQGPLHGYGHVTTGPVGGFPPTKYLSLQARRGDPYPYDPSEARRLLRTHGWTQASPGAVATCTQPGSGPADCGQGVRRGAQLTFSLYYATGQAWLESALLQLKSNASQVGIDITLKPKTFNGVLSVVEGAGCPPAGCSWEMADWGLGWSYVPDYLPTGDELFQTGSFGNLGKYSDQQNDTLIKQTLASSDMHLMWKWENYLTKQLPVVFQPDAPAALVESISNLHIGTQSPTLAINPEEWYFLR
jgi:peptide/nickel transport system substrate-binding protein